MIGALVSGGLSLLGGLFGRSDKKKQEREAARNQAEAERTNAVAIENANRMNMVIADQLTATPLTENVTTGIRRSLDVDGMMAAAERSGFNPVTFLQNGGMQAFISEWSESSSTTRGHNAAAAAQLASPQVQQVAPKPVSTAPGIGSIVTGALTAGYGAYAENQQRLQDQQFQKDMLDRQIAGVAKANAMKGGRSMYVPSTTTSGATGTSRGTGALSASPILGALPGTDRTSSDPYRIPGMYDPTLPDAQIAEARFGEIGGEIAGISNIFGDYWFQQTGMTSEQRRQDPGKAASIVYDNVRHTVAPYLSAAWNVIAGPPVAPPQVVFTTPKTARLPANPQTFGR